jgi:hypothetical protein
VLDQRSRHVREHGSPVLRLAVELTMGVEMAHGRMSDAGSQMTDETVILTSDL